MGPRRKHGRAGPDEELVLYRTWRFRYKTWVVNDDGEYVFDFETVAIIECTETWAHIVLWACVTACRGTWDITIHRNSKTTGKGRTSRAPWYNIQGEYRFQNLQRGYGHFA